jgi:integrase
MGDVFRKVTVIHKDQDGKRCGPGTPGAKRVVIKSKKWYGTVGGKHKALATDKSVARRLLVKYQSEQLEIDAGIRRPAEEKEVEETSLVDHLRKFIQSMRDAGKPDKYVKETKAEVEKVLKGCGFEFARDLDDKAAASKVMDYLARRREEEGVSTRTTNSQGASVKRFAKWLGLHRTGRITLSLISGGNVELDRRRVRRDLSDEEFWLVVRAAEASTVSYRGLDGRARGLLYQLAAWTGLRSNELGTLVRESFDLERGTLRLAVKDEKNRRGNTLPLHPDLIGPLQAYLANVPAGAKVFPGSWSTNKRGARMLRIDLEAANVPYVTAEGYFDLHAHRNRFCSSLARENTPVKLACELSRHSDPKLLLKVYARVRADEKVAAVASLPGRPST